MRKQFKGFRYFSMLFEHMLYKDVYGYPSFLYKKRDINYMLKPFSHIHKCTYKIYASNFTSFFVCTSFNALLYNIFLAYCIQVRASSPQQHTLLFV